MADTGQGGNAQDAWPRGVPPSHPPPVPFMAPPPPQPYPPGAGYPVAYQPIYQPVMPVFVDPPKSKVAAALLAFFLGVLGIHNFYLGRVGLGLAQLLLATIGGVVTCGLATIGVAIWAFVEFIVILCGGVRDNHGRPLV